MEEYSIGDLEELSAELHEKESAAFNAREVVLNLLVLKREKRDCETDPLSQEERDALGEKIEQKEEELEHLLKEV